MKPIWPEASEPWRWKVMALLSYCSAVRGDLESGPLVRCQKGMNGFQMDMEVRYREKPRGDAPPGRCYCALGLS